MRFLVILISLFFAAPPAMAKCLYQDKAKVQYQAGSKHYKSKEYSKAIEAFNQVQKLCPTVAMLFNLARAHDKAGNTDKAVSLYQEYLKLKDPKATPIDIKKRIKDLREGPAGDWTDPFELESKVVNKAPAKKKQKPVECPAVTSSQEPQEPRYKRPWAWVASGVGLGLVATGTALLATRQVNEWQRNGDTGKLESVTGSVAPGAALVAAGAVAAGVGVWLFVRDESDRRDDEAGSTVTLNLSPTGTGFALSGSF